MMLLRMQFTALFDYSKPRQERINITLDKLGNEVYPTMQARAQISVSYDNAAPPDGGGGGGGGGGPVPSGSPPPGGGGPPGASPPPAGSPPPAPSPPPSPPPGASPSRTRSATVSPTPALPSPDPPVPVFFIMSMKPGATSPKHSVYHIGHGAVVTGNATLEGDAAEVYGAPHVVYLSARTGMPFEITVTPMDAFMNKQTRAITLGTISASTCLPMRL